MQSNYRIAEKTREVLQKWTKEECRRDPSLSLVASLVGELKAEGMSFETSQPEKKKKGATTMDAARKEEDDLARAIQMSLKESAASSQASGGVGKSRSSGAIATVTTAPLYPAAQAAAGDRVVKALYDFEAAEDNELTFKAGEHITILDDSDMNWWKGRNRGGSGLFPASFVTADLAAPVEGVEASASGGGKKSVQFDDAVKVEELPTPPEEVGIDEAKLGRCLELLKDADPTGDRPDPPELAPLEEQCRAMGPLIDAELAALDREANALTDVDVRIRDALALYNSAMHDATQQLQAQMAHAAVSAPPQPPHPAYPPANPAYPPTSAHQHPQSYAAPNHLYQQPSAVPSPAQPASIQAYAAAHPASLTHIPAAAAYAPPQSHLAYAAPPQPSASYQQ